MTPDRQADWEDVLNAYLEGRGLRADAEDLLMRLHLAPADRDTIERSLRLADSLTESLRQAQPSVGAGTRLAAVLRDCPPPASVPHAWRHAGAGFARPTTVAPAPQEEDLLDAALDGRVSLEQLLALRKLGQLSETGEEALDELQSVAAAVNATSPDRTLPTGFAGRLRVNLRSHMDSEAGEIDPRIAERLLDQWHTTHPRRSEDPDVLAAEEDPDPT